MEVGGLVVGVVGVAALATLFHDCIESFDCFRAADKDFEGLLVELDMEKARLLYWGNEVGILNAEGEGQATQLKEDAIARLIERALKSIQGSPRGCKCPAAEIWRSSLDRGHRRRYDGV